MGLNHLLKITFLVLTIFAFLPKAAEAGFIVQRPLYIGLANGLVGYWSFDGPDVMKKKIRHVVDGLSYGPEETCTPFIACRGQYVTTYTTGPGPLDTIKQKEPFYKDSFCRHATLAYV